MVKVKLYLDLSDMKKRLLLLHYVGAVPKRNDVFANRARDGGEPLTAANRWPIVRTRLRSSFQGRYAHWSP